MITASTNESAPALSCRGLLKSFGGNHVLRGLDLELPPGTLTVLTGGNGSGKTTLLDIVSGFICADAGTVAVGRSDTTGMAPHKVARLGVARTFQHNRLVTQGTVRDNLVLGTAEPSTETLRSILYLRRARPILDSSHAGVALLMATNLERSMYHKAGTLSFGQQKIVAIACAISQRATLLLMDEPLAGLSRAARGPVASALNAAKAAGSAVLVVEHEPAILLDAADQLLVLVEGQLTSEHVGTVS